MPVISRGPTLGDQVYTFIRDRIISGEYQPGQILVESELANELQVSRTPVSNAVIMLKERGLLEEQAGKPAVPKLTLKVVTDLYLCRLALDGLASRLAAGSIEDEDIAKLEHNLKAWKEPVPDENRTALWVADLSFHETIYRVSGNKHLMRFAQITTELAAVYRRSTFRRLASTEGDGKHTRTQDDIREEHQDILRALKDRDPDKAEQAARNHIQNVIDHLGQSEVINPDLP